MTEFKWIWLLIERKSSYGSFELNTKSKPIQHLDKKFSISVKRSHFSFFVLLDSKTTYFRTVTLPHSCKKVQTRTVRQQGKRSDTIE